MRWETRETFIDPIDVARSPQEWELEIMDAKRIIDELIRCDLGKTQAVYTLVAGIHNILKNWTP